MIFLWRADFMSVMSRNLKENRTDFSLYQIYLENQFTVTITFNKVYILAIYHLGTDPVKGTDSILLSVFKTRGYSEKTGYWVCYDYWKHTLMKEN